MSNGQLHDIGLESRIAAKRGSEDSPAYRRGLNRCPFCGSDQVALLAVDPRLIVVHRPRQCSVCNRNWTPVPGKFWLVLNIVFGMLFCVGSVCGLIMLPVLLHDWLNDTRGFTAFRLVFFSIVLLGGALSASLGIACIRFGCRHLRTDPHRDS